MAKHRVLVLFNICLLLQLVTSEPYQSFSSFVKEDIDLRQTESSKATEINLPSEVSSLLIYTAILVEQHGRQIISESCIFLKKALSKLSELSPKSESIQVNITRFQNLLQRCESIDLNGDTSAILSEKSILIKDITQLLADLNLIAENDTAKNDVAIIKNAFSEADFKEFQMKLDESKGEIVHKFSIVFNIFWSSLSEEEKKLLASLNNWYADFYAAKSEEIKFNYFVKFFELFEV